MPVDTSIYNAIGHGVKTYSDYEAEDQTRKTNALGLAQGQQNLLMGKQKLDEYGRGVAEQQRYRDALRGATPDDVPGTVQKLNAAGLGDLALKYQKDALGNLETRGKIDETAAKTTGDKLNQSIKAHEFHVQQLGSVNTPEDAMAWAQQGLKAGVFTPEQYQRGVQALQQAATNPASFNQWRQQAMQGGMSVTEQLKAQQAATTQKETGRHNMATEQNATGMLGVSQGNLSVARGNLGLRAQEIQNSSTANGKPPSGYAWGATGADGNPTLIAVKGGPADLKMAGALNADTQALNGSISGFDRLATAANEVLNHPGLKSITGMRGVVPNIPGSDAANAQALLGTLKSQVGFGVLQDMRNNSKTGGALGSLSDAEGKRLEANLAALDRAQSEDQYRTSLRKIIDYAEQAKGRTREAFNLKHGGSAGDGSKPSAPAQRPPLSSFGGK